MTRFQNRVKPTLRVAKKRRAAPQAVLVLRWGRNSRHAARAHPVAAAAVGAAAAAAVVAAAKELLALRTVLAAGLRRQRHRNPIHG